MRTNKKRVSTLFGAISVGFASALALHGPLGPSSTHRAISSPTTTAPPRAGSPGTATTTTTTSPVASSPVSGTALGRVENYGYGQFAVQVSVTNSHIVGLSVKSLQTLESYSQQLEQQVVPILKNEVLQAQGTRISAVSGATYTSEAYAYSVQSALDQLHFK